MQRGRSRLCEQQGKSSICGAERGRFLEVQSDGANCLPCVDERRRKVGLHIGELAEAGVSAAVTTLEFRAGLERDHLALTQCIDEWNRRLERYGLQVRDEVRTKAAAAENLDLVVIDGDKHPASCFDHRQAFAEYDARDIVNGPGLRQRCCQIEELLRASSHAIELLTQAGDVRWGFSHRSASPSVRPDSSP